MEAGAGCAGEGSAVSPESTQRHQGQTYSPSLGPDLKDIQDLGSNQIIRPAGGCSPPGFLLVDNFKLSSYSKQYAIESLSVCVL